MALKEQPWYVRFNAYGITLAVLVFAISLAGFITPYHPFEFYGWKNVPPEVCPLEAFDSSYVSEVRSGPYSIGHLEEGAALMLNENEEVVDSWEYEPLDLEPYPRTIKSSVAVRSAPLEPGVYHFGLQGKLDGRMFYVVPTYQNINEVGDETIKVLPLSDKRCKDIIERG